MIDIILNDQWLCITDLANALDTDTLLIQNKSTNWGLLQESDIQPTNNSGVIITDLRNAEPSKQLTGKIWGKSSSSDRPILINVQILDSGE